MSKKTVYFKQVESLYQHLIKGIVIYENIDSGGKYSITECGTSEIHHIKVYNRLIVENGENEYKKVQEFYNQEKIVKDAQKKLEEMRDKL